MANLNIVTQEDLFIACQLGYLKAISDFFDAHENNPQYILETINKYDDSRNYPLVAAVQYGHLEIVEKLLEAGADIEIGKCNGSHSLKNIGITPLVMACSMGDLAIIKSLIARGADIETKQDDGKTPLVVAIEYFKLEVVKLLLAFGADVNVMVVSDNSSVLAKTSTDVPSIITLTSPLHLAISNRFTPVVELLLKYGALYEHKDTLAGDQEVITTVWQLCERDKKTEKLYKNLLGGQWTTKNHHRHPQCIKDAVFTVLLINKRLNCMFDKPFLYNLFSLIAYSWKK